MASDDLFDLRGSKCPLPIVKLNLRSRTLAPGQGLAFLADDPAFPLDVEAWARRTGHELAWDVATSAACHKGTIRRVA
jgi:tRNA 2-thiouridine synthesizing protein A